MDSVKNSINNELKKENPDYKSMERLFNLHQTLESNREELASELRESILHKPLSPVKEESKRIDVAIVIGHKKTSPGVVNSKTSISEFEYNEGISILIERYLTKLEITAERVYRRTFSELPDDINKLNPVVMISLHANALNGQLSGSEVLYLADSESGMKLAKLMLKKIVDALALPDRGIKGITPQDRGGYLLNNTRSTSIIMEPFFMDNDSDVSTAIQKKEELANAIALGLNEYITTIR